MEASPYLHHPVTGARATRDCASSTCKSPACTSPAPGFLCLCSSSVLIVFDCNLDSDQETGACPFIPGNNRGAVLKPRPSVSILAQAVSRVWTYLVCTSLPCCPPGLTSAVPLHAQLAAVLGWGWFPAPRLPRSLTALQLVRAQITFPGEHPSLLLPGTPLPFSQRHQRCKKKFPYYISLCWTKSYNLFDCFG